MSRPAEQTETIQRLIQEAHEVAYHEPEQGLALAREAFGQLTLEDDLALHLQVRSALVNSLAIVGERQEGLKEAWELLALATEAGDLSVQATANQHIATLLASLGQYQQSLPYFQAARLLSAGLHPGQYATSTLNLADTLEKLGHLQDAEETYLSVLSLPVHDQEVQVVQAYARLSLVGLKVLGFEMGQRSLEDLQPGTAQLEQVLQEARTARDRFLELYTHALQTRLQVHLGNQAAAEQAGEAAWSLARDLNQPGAWACAHEARAHLRCLQEDHQAAMEAFEAAAEHLEALALGGELLQLLNSYVRHLKFWRQHEKAFEVLWKLHTLDQLVRTEGVLLQAQMVTLQMQIELARKENELHMQHVRELQQLQQQLQLQNQLLEKLSREDELTGVYNRRHAVHLLRGLGEGPGCVLLLFDVDHFKRINDGFGHSMGDTVLKGIATLVRRHLKTGDVFGRLGGEEFVVALAGGTLQDGEKLAHQICQAVSAARWEGLKGNQVTLSIGVALFRGGTLEAALHEADEALYEAKGRGRNCVVVRPFHG